MKNFLFILFFFASLSYAEVDHQCKELIKEDLKERYTNYLDVHLKRLPDHIQYVIKGTRKTNYMQAFADELYRGMTDVSNDSSVRFTNEAITNNTDETRHYYFFVESEQHISEVFGDEYVKKLFHDGSSHVPDFKEVWGRILN